MKNNLKAIREATIDPLTGKTYTQAGLGKAMGKDENTIRCIENGVRNFTLTTAGRACEILGCDIHDLIDLPKPKGSHGFDRDLMELSVGFTLEACKKYKVNIDKNGKQVSNWSAQVYEGKVKMKLMVPQMRELAFMLVKTSQNGKRD